MQRALVCIMLTWIVIGGCTSTTSSDGCYGFWEDNKWGLKRGTIVGKNANYKKPYRQCVDKDSHWLNKEKRPYG